MKRFTSIFMTTMLCLGLNAQGYESAGSDFPKDKVVKIGTAQAEMKPGQWYFVHNVRPSRGGADAANFVTPGESIRAFGGLVTDNGFAPARMSPTSVIEQLSVEQGVNANNYAQHMVRFVSVENVDGAYNVQFGTENWLDGNLSVVSNDNYVSGGAGQYNFYLVTESGTPNTSGRFAWNKHDMANRVDNNGAGNTLAFWSSGKITETLVGNNIWQIYDVQILGDVDFYEESLKTVYAKYANYSGLNGGMFIEDLRNEVNVGSAYGNYIADNVNAFLALHDKIVEMIKAWEFEGVDAVKAEYPTIEDVEALAQSYSDAYEYMVENKVPISMTNITPGYYTINSMLPYNDGEIKSICSRDENGEELLAWGSRESKIEFLWKVEAVDGKPYEYRLINMYRSTTFTAIGGQKTYLVSDSLATVCFDWRGDDGIAPVTGETVTYFNIRCSNQPVDNYYYVHCGGHGSGAGQQGNIVSWTDGGATQWYLAPVEQTIVDSLLAEGDKQAQFVAKVAKADSIVAAVPAQIEIAKDLEITVNEYSPLLVSADQFYSQYSTNDGQAIPDGKTVYNFLIDGDQGTYWHSKWENGNQPALKHYLQINATETLDGLHVIKLTRRPVANDHITKIVVKGYTSKPTDATTYEEGVEIATLDLPFGSNTETLMSKYFDASGMNYLRFYPAATTTGRGYWHASEFNMFKVTSEKRQETVQYDVRKDEAEALEAAVAAWKEKGYTGEMLDLMNDETFLATYEALVAAYDAWSNVFVDPAPLREAIDASLAASGDLYVIGNNPGQWKADGFNPRAALDAAKAYLESGAYTSEESQYHLDELAKSGDDAFATANKVEAGKWYRFNFATEELYNIFGWDKSGAKANVHAISGIEQSPALFGKTVAVGRGVIQYVPYVDALGQDAMLDVYSVEPLKEFQEGNGLYLFDNVDFKNGEDLFQFIPASDSSYMIQNKATGLFLRVNDGVTLSMIPSYFDVKAIGAGATVIESTDIFGNKTNPLHSERLTNRLVSWNETSLGSNSMIMIEEVESVTETPTETFTKEFVPGRIYGLTYPVDVAIVEGATAYDAELVLTEQDTTVLLKAMESDTILAGTPFFMIAENNNNGSAKVTMKHGVTVNTTVAEHPHLVGTMQSVTVDAGKGVITNGYGFRHTPNASTVSAYSAYIKCDFDASTNDVYNPIYVKFGSGPGTPETDPNNPENYENVIFGADAEFYSDQEYVLPIYMNNTEDIISWEFNLVLPEGINVKKNARGYYEIALSDYRTDSHQLITKDIDGGISIAAYSMNNSVYAGNSGVVAYVTLVCDNDITPGEHIVSYDNIVMTKASNVNEAFTVEHVESSITIATYMLGDVNGDGVVNVTDISGVIALWMGNTSPSLHFSAADINKDNIINVIDISGVISIFLGEYPAQNAAARTRGTEAYGSIYIDPVNMAAGETAEVLVKLDNPGVDVISAQFDLYLPNGFEVATTRTGKYQVSIGSRLDDHQILVNPNEDGSIRVAVYSMTNTSFWGNEGDILTIKLQAAEDVENGKYELELKNQVLTSSVLEGLAPANTSSLIEISTTTGIGSVLDAESNQPVYDMQGRPTKAVQRGVYIKNGNKVIIK